MTAPTDEGLTRAERWARSAQLADAERAEHLAAEREAREQERWDKLYHKLDMLPLVFFGWYLLLSILFGMLYYVLAVTH